MKWLNVKRHSRSAHTRIVRRARRVGGRAFSLVEVMIGIFILGIGIIAISALFPAGIAQQQFSNDDIIGSIVANNAMTVIRGKVSPADFGTFEEFGISTGNTPRPTISGDWAWIRPSIILEDDPGTIANERGTVDIFGFARANGFFLTANSVVSASESFDDGNSFWSIPFNSARYGNTTPLIAITQAERYYPQQTELVAAGQRQQPQYVWDCMFRRYGGRIYVAIFVYRVADPEAQANGPYRVVRAIGDDTITPIPHRLSYGPGSFGSSGNFNTWVVDNNPVDGIAPGPANVLLPDQAWQKPRQWIVDQNTNIHRVVSNYPIDPNDPDSKVQVELVRPVPDMPPVAPNWFEPNSNSPVSDIWFIPLVDFVGRELTPVYVTVQEL